jgi:hypothetical protein
MNGSLTAGDFVKKSYQGGVKLTVPLASLKRYLQL